MGDCAQARIHSPTLPLCRLIWLNDALRRREFIGGVLLRLRSALDTTNEGSGRRPASGKDDPMPCKVLDPFAGAGTTGMLAALTLTAAKRCVIELNSEYCKIMERRLADQVVGTVD